jgi:hypothetical protein
MLRNRYGWAWRRFVAFLFLFFLTCPTARGGPLTGLPPLKPVIPSKPQVPTTYSLSGYVYNDPTAQGVYVSGDAGLSAVVMTLLQSSSAGTQTFTGYTNSVGYYAFSGLVAGDSYTLTETQPANFNTTADNIGYFQSSTGGTLTVPAGASLGALSPPSSISGIVFAPTSSGAFSAVDYNFGESPQDFYVVGVPGRPRIPGGSTPGVSASFSTSLSVVGTNARFLAGSLGTAGSLGMTGLVVNTGSAAAGGVNWQIASQSTGLSLAPASGTGLAPGAPQILTGTVIGTSLSPGTQEATLTVTGKIGTNGTLVASSGSATIDPVYSRGIDSVSTANLGRIMAGATTAPAAITITSTGAYANYSNLTLNGGTSAAATDSSGDAFNVVNGATVLYNGTTTSNAGGTAFTATFSSAASGPLSGTAAVPGNTGLFTGDQTLASGTPALPTLNVPYTATVLQPRQLTAGSAFTLPVPAGDGGLLAGGWATVPAAYSVMSTTDSNHTTSVYVTGSGVLALYSTNGTSAYQPPDQVGQVNATQTLVNSAGATTVPVSVQVQAQTSYGPYTAVASLNVVTAESAAVKDTTAYAPVNLAFNVANVGFAATGGPSLTNPAVQNFGAPLTSAFLPGQTLGTFSIDSSGNFNGVSLTSAVASAGTAGAASTVTYTYNAVAQAYTPYNGTTLLDPYNPVAINTTTAKGPVGSQCDILASTPLSASDGTATVTMAWRNRDSSENLTAPIAGKLPPGIQWLTSDVVDIAGVPSDVTFAMEMSYDDQINTTLDSEHLSGTIQGSFIGELVGSGTNAKWVNAVSQNATTGSHAQTAVAGSLTTFLATYESAPYNYTLQQLAGSWGVDLANQESWAIVNGGGGQFAVMPEPSTWLLLGTGLAGLLGYRARRKLRVKSAAA